jgi:hypothetical protein
MRFLAAYAVKGPWQAVGVTAVAALLSLLLPPLSYLSGATVALVTLRMGLQQGLRLVFGAAVLLSLLAMLLVQNPLAGAVYAIALWLPVWALSLSLRRTASPARSVLLATLLGAVAVVAFHLSTADTVQWWSGFLQEALAEAIAELPQSEQAPFLASLDYMAAIMTGVMAAALSASLLGCLFLGRWWQALLYNPGGFGEEFRQLSLGRNITLAAALLLLVQLVPVEAPVLLQDLLVVAMVPFAIQGLAVAHALVKQSGAHRGWLIALYLVLLLATGQTVVVLAFAGALDNWMDFRRLFGPRGGAG